MSAINPVVGEKGPPCPSCSKSVIRRVHGWWCQYCRMFVEFSYASNADKLSRPNDPWFVK